MDVVGVVVVVRDVDVVGVVVVVREVEIDVTDVDVVVVTV